MAKSRKIVPKAKKKLKPAVGKVASKVQPAATLEAVGGNEDVAALQAKLDAIRRISDALRERLGGSPATDDTINAQLDSLSDQEGIIEAQITAVQEGTLPPPTQGDVTAIQNAIRAADNVIAQNAGINQLITAATAIIKTFKK